MFWSDLLSYESLGKIFFLDSFYSVSTRHPEPTPKGILFGIFTFFFLKCNIIINFQWFSKELLSSHIYSWIKQLLIPAKFQVLCGH